MLEAACHSFPVGRRWGTSLEVAFNQLFADTVGARGALWVAPDAKHTGAFDRYPDEYERRVIDFLDARLSPFDKLRVIMVSLSNHGPHRFDKLRMTRAIADLVYGD